MESRLQHCAAWLCLWSYGEVGQWACKSPPLNCGNQWEPERRYAFWARRLYINRQFCTDYTDASYLQGTLSHRTSAPGKLFWMVNFIGSCVMQYDANITIIVPSCWDTVWCNFSVIGLTTIVRWACCERVHCYTLFWICSHSWALQLPASKIFLCMSELIIMITSLSVILKIKLQPSGTFLYFWEGLAPLQRSTLWWNFEILYLL